MPSLVFGVVELIDPFLIEIPSFDTSCTSHPVCYLLFSWMDVAAVRRPQGRSPLSLSILCSGSSSAPQMRKRNTHTPHTPHTIEESGPGADDGAEWPPL